MARRILPPRVKEAVVEVCGKAYWYKDPLLSLMREAGVPDDIIVKYEEFSKYKIARNVLHDLELMGDDGWAIQKKLVLRLCQLRKVGADVPDRNAGLDALRELKTAAVEEELVRRKEKQEAVARRKKLDLLRLAFSEMVMSNKPQARGYRLELLVAELFALSEIDYHKSYKNEVVQVDGFFRFEGFEYLVEARWRKERPPVSEVGGFKVKVDSTFQSARGIFIAVQGVEDHVARHFSRSGGNIIFVDGQDLLEILEARWSLADALRAKIEHAVRMGHAHYILRGRR